VLKIAVISHLYPSPARPTYGQFIHAHVKALQAQGVAVRVVSPVPWTPPGLEKISRKWADYAASAGRVEDFDGVRVARPAYFTPPSPFHVAGSWTMAVSLRRCWKKLMDGFKCDLIHAHTVTPDGFAAVKFGKKLGLPVVCSARGSEVHEAPRCSPTVRRQTRWALQNCDGFLAVSRALAQTAVELADGRLQPAVIYNGVAENFSAGADTRKIRRQLGLPETAKIILFVGRCERDKGAGELLGAFAAIARAEPAALLLVVGDGGARTELESTAKSAHGSRVRFAGLVGRDKIAGYFQAADVFVLPSYGEGMPNALLEAMAAGLPCVATRVGGIPEAIQDGVNGILIPPKSAPAVVQAVGKIFAEPDFARNLGRAARATVTNKFSWQANAANHLKFYHKTLESWTKRKQQQP